MTMHRVAFGLGGNRGDVAAALRDAVHTLAARPELTVAGVSSLYETAPVGGPAQPDYLNAVVVADTAVDPAHMLALAQEIEQRWHRTRDVRWGPRTLDVDILAFGAMVSDDPRLTLPHPRAHLRAFVLVPWAEVDPDFVVPGLGPVHALRDALPDAGGVAVRSRGRIWLSEAVAGT